MVELPVSYLGSMVPAAACEKAVFIVLVERYLFAHRLSLALSPPDCYCYGKGKKLITDRLDACAAANDYQKGPDPPVGKRGSTSLAFQGELTLEFTA